MLKRNDGLRGQSNASRIVLVFFLFFFKRVVLGFSCDALAWPGHLSGILGLLLGRMKGVLEDMKKGGRFGL
jgi:hypothetical protein